MASRKEQKEAARQRRLEEERARAERARRTQRLRMAGGIVIAVVAVLAVAIAVSSGGGGGTNGLLKGTKAKALVSQVSSLLNGIPQSGTTLGSPSAPVTMTYYGDLQCPVCQAFTVDGGFPQFVSNDVRTGKVKVVYRAFQTATQDPAVFQNQQVAALAAGQQNKFWDYTELFYHQQGKEATGYVNESYLSGLAAQVPGLSTTAWKGARSNATLASQVTADGAAGRAANIQGTPTLVFKGPKGSAEAPSGVPSYNDLQTTLKQVS